MYNITLGEIIVTSSSKQISENDIYELIIKNISNANEVTDVQINMDLYNYYFYVEGVHSVYVKYELNEINYLIRVNIEVEEEKPFFIYENYIIIFIFLIYILIKLVKSEKNID